MRPQRRDALYSSTVRGRFVVLDPRARQLAELHPDMQTLWPLLDGKHTLTELAGLWSVAAGAPTENDRLRMIRAVTDQLAEAGLLAPDDTVEETT